MLDIKWLRIITDGLFKFLLQKQQKIAMTAQGHNGCIYLLGNSFLRKVRERGEFTYKYLNECADYNIGQIKWVFIETNEV